MPLPMPHYNAFAAHAPIVPSCQAGPRSNRKLISATLIALHFDKDLIRIFIIIPLQCRAQEQQIFYHALKQLQETHIRANYTRLLQRAAEQGRIQERNVVTAAKT